MPNDTAPMYALSADDVTMIARALHEAASRHSDLHNIRGHFRHDNEVGECMREVLERQFPDHARAFDQADKLRTALAAGYLPPAGGASPESVKTFLAGKGERHSAPPIRFTLDDDIPW